MKKILAKSNVPANWHLMRPDNTMGAEIWGLVNRCQPLDINSRYCYLLLCQHFSMTSMVATDVRGGVIGFVSGYLIPERPHALFIWQVAVDEHYRGRGLAREMILGILMRKACEGVAFLETTTTLSNGSSWSLFKKIADHLHVRSDVTTLFDRRQHFDCQQDTEMLVRIGPFEPGNRS